jgi:hypothetical protein
MLYETDFHFKGSTNNFVCKSPMGRWCFRCIFYESTSSSDKRDEISQEAEAIFKEQERIIKQTCSDWHLYVNQDRNERTLVATNDQSLEIRLIISGETFKQEEVALPIDSSYLSNGIFNPWRSTFVVRLVLIRHKSNLIEDHSF